MGLDAYVFCDCFERGRIRSGPPESWGVYVDENGDRTPRDLKSRPAFFEWNLNACDHERGILLHYRLGHAGLIAIFRSGLKPIAEKVPILFNKVVYNGVHAGDFVNPSEVHALSDELAFLPDHHLADAEEEKYFRQFAVQLQALTTCALSLHKPISF